MIRISFDVLCALQCWGIHLTPTHIALAKFQHRNGPPHGSTIPSVGAPRFMPLEKAKFRAQLLKEIRKAVKEAEAAGVTDAIKLVKKILESRALYIKWKYQIKR
jgi:hypothetical protein